MIAPIVTRGYGNWGSVNQLPTRGYGIGAPPAIYTPPTVSGSVNYQQLQTGTINYQQLQTGTINYQQLQTGAVNIP